MKRSWMGFALLVVLLAGSVLVTWAMGNIHDPIEQDLNQAAECAVLGDWVNAQRFFVSAKDGWKKWEHFRASFADHTPIEEIDADFAALEVYLYAQETIGFSAVSSSLARQVAAVGEAHELVWWNIL